MTLTYLFLDAVVNRHARMANRLEEPDGLRRLVRSWHEPWMVDAACAYVDPELWFPDVGGSPKDARKICATCPVATQCREYAVLNRERFGIWGNTSEADRRKLFKKAAA